MLQHHRLDWNAPLLPAVTAGLLERASNEGKDLRHLLAPVSYTHLTLPTKA